MDQLLAPLPGVCTALDIGCGTGHFTRWLASRGVVSTGLDLSAEMLAVAKERSAGIRYLQGAAEALPFADRSFDLAAFVTSLEFVADRERALVEAARVARRGLLLGALNLASPLGLYRKTLSRFRPSSYRHARFFTPWGLERRVRRLLGDRVERVTVRTTLWPRVVPIEVSRVPFGAFIGMVVALKDASTETFLSPSRCVPVVPARVMVIFAHPDDAEFTCGGTVAAWTRAGSEVAYVVCTDGGKGADNLPLASEELAEARREEQREAARRLGVRDVYFLGHSDGGLARVQGLEEELVGLIRQFRPELVLAWDPWKRYQLHPDHRAAGAASLDAVMAAANPRMYPEQLNGGGRPHRTEMVYLFGAEEPDTWVDVSDTFGAKLEAIALHGSQVRDREELATWMARCNREYGAQAGCAYAEAFKTLKPFCQV